MLLIRTILQDSVPFGDSGMLFFAVAIFIDSVVAFLRTVSRPHFPTVAKFQCSQ
jgi:hypothetical protein